MQTPEQILAEAKRWKAIYPPYIDGSLTTSQGRRIGREKCVLYPQLMEISQCLSQLGLKHVVEQHKIYSKDLFQIGRIKVRLFTDDHKPINPQVKCKHSLLLIISRLLKSIPNRKVEKPAYIAQMETEKQNRPQQKQKGSSKKTKKRQ